MEINWFTMFIFLIPLCGFAIVPLICLYVLLLPNYLLRPETGNYGAMEMYMQLPVKRNDVVKARVLYIALWQIAVCTTFALGALFCFVASMFFPKLNFNSTYQGLILSQNLSLLGILLLSMGLHNAIVDLFSSYYKRIGVSVLAIALCWALNTIAVRFAANYLDGYNVAYLWTRVVVFVAGTGAFCGLTYIGYKRNSKKFASML